MSQNNQVALSVEDEETLVRFLGHVYAAVPWHKMRTAKNPHDIFNHRVRSAACRGTLYAFASTLCNYFGLQTMPADAQALLDALRHAEEVALNKLATEHIPLCVRGIIAAKEIKAGKKKGD